MGARRWAASGAMLLASLASPSGWTPGVRPAAAYFVTHPKTLDELAKGADVVVKGTVVSDLPVTDPWFERISGYEVREALLAVASALKGSVPAKTIRFRHYAPTQGPRMYAPLHATLAPGRTYVVFASDAGGGVYRQHTKDPSEKDGEGVILAGDAKPHRGRTVTEAVWAELAALLAGKAPDDVVTAIHELDERSGGGLRGVSDFARRPVLDLLRPLIAKGQSQVQTAALGVFGTKSPYTDDEAAPYILASAPKSVISGLVARPIVKNTEADIAVQEITAIADGNGPGELRSLAIRTLGRSASVKGAPIARWFGDPEPLVRRAAVLLAADAPDAKLISAAAADPSEAVRHGAARAIGFAQDVSLIPMLGRLLQDPSVKVRTAAACSLLSFSPDDAGPVLKAYLASDYRALFVNALARKDPSSYLPELADVIEKDLSPSDWWGGRIPSVDSWEMLFEHVKKQPKADLTGKLAPSLDALEKAKWTGSSQPLSLYSLYLLRGLGPRAKLFRDKVQKSVSYDMSSFFDMADKNPATYVQP